LLVSTVVGCVVARVSIFGVQRRYTVRIYERVSSSTRDRRRSIVTHFVVIVVFFFFFSVYVPKLVTDIGRGEFVGPVASVSMIFRHIRYRNFELTRPRCIIIFIIILRAHLDISTVFSELFFLCAVATVFGATT
jgi:hypothetical protein